MIESRYGLRWDTRFWTPIKIEAACLARRWPVDKGGLGHYGHLKNMMQLLWPDRYAGTFLVDGTAYPRWRPDTDRIVHAWCDYSYISLIGHASASKTHDVAHIAVAEYLSSPDDTIVELTSTDLQGLKKRIFHEALNGVKKNAYYPEIDLDYTDSPHPTLRQKINEAAEAKVGKRVRKNAVSKEAKFTIMGIPTGDDKDAVARIQGNHSTNHHYLIVDEAEGTPAAIFTVPANLATDPDFKFVQLANPFNKFSACGNECCPVGGWSAIDPEVVTEWHPAAHQNPDGTNSGIVLRFDALNSPNIVAHKKVYPFLVSEESIRAVVSKYSDRSPEYWAYVRGMFPPDNINGVIFPSATINNLQTDVVFEAPPTRIAAFDPAFEGGDTPALIIAELGKEIDTPDNPGLGFVIRAVASMSVQKIIRPDRPLDYCLADEVKRICQSFNVEPENFIMDSTGTGRGVAAILKMEWSSEINALSYGSAATDRLVLVGESKTAKELYDRYVTELWFAARVFADYRHIRGFIGDSWSKTLVQLAARQYTLYKEKMQKAETKQEMKKRTKESPDFGDCFCMLVELARRKGAIAKGFLDMREDSTDSFSVQAEKIMQSTRDDNYLSIDIKGYETDNSM